MIRLVLALSVLIATGGCRDRSASDPKVLVLGFDGMDPAFVRRHADRLPNLMRLGESGGFVDLQTVMPPQSPVAWSTVITGLSPGGHGVYDFVHRRPEDMSPFSSMAETVPPEWVLQVGDWVVPLDSGETRPLRHGRAFWEVLAEHDVESLIMKMPTDFPPLAAATAALSGMGTPDMMGSFGTFQLFTDDPSFTDAPDLSGGEVHPVEVHEHRIEAAILGPVNSFLAAQPRTAAAFSVRLDPEHPVARIEVGDQVVVVQQGGWSDWVRLEFELIPWLKTSSGIVRFFLAEARPHFRLYVSPVNLDPLAPEIPISSPPDFAAELAAEIGPYYTQGMAEETKGLSAHVIDRAQFVDQANLVFDEEIAMYRAMLGRFARGMMFYYFSTTDQAAHMLWGDHEDLLVPIYERADEVVGETLASIDDDTMLMVISDHGFQRFDREVNLNRWLMDEGWLVLDDPANVGLGPGFPHVDWSNTQVYAMGLNALYFNRKGRESQGIVVDDDLAALAAEVSRRLLALEDPKTGARVVARVYDVAEWGGDNRATSPDLMVGFAPPYRTSPEGGLGAISREAIGDNEDEWIGDHCMAHDTVPGVLFANRPLAGEEFSLHDVPVTVLRAFSIQPPTEMIGRDVFSP